MLDANPLRQPKPSAGEVIYSGRFLPARENGSHESGAAFVRYSVQLTATQVWISPELSIPIDRIKSTEIMKGVLRRGLAIYYQNPITRQLEGTFLCKMDPLGLGLYRLAPLQELSEQIERARAELGSEEQSPARLATSNRVDQESADSDRACEVCGAKPSYYVPHTFLIALVLIWYRSGDTRRVHCKKHLLINGAWRYLLTATTGWAGLSIIAYPFLLFRTATNLKPAIGRVSYVLAFLPLPIVGFLVWKIAEAIA